jgi:hypothetical protein
VDTVSDKEGGNGGGNGAVEDFSNSYWPRDTRTEGGDSTTFIFSGNGGSTLFWN